MSTFSGWTQLERRRWTRRQTIAAGGAVAGALTATGLSACGGSTRGSPSSNAQSGTATASTTPRPGGNLSILVQTNYPLDPQKVSALAQQIPVGR